MSLKNFKLLKDEDNMYHLESPKGKRFTVPKSELNDNAHSIIKSLAPKKMFSGGFPDSASVFDSPQVREQMAMNEPPAQAPTELNYAPEPAKLINEAPVQPQASAPAPTPVDPITQSGLDTDARLSKEENAVNDVAKAEAASGAQSAKAWGDYANQVQQLPNPMQVQAEHKAKDDALIKAVSENKIDPNRLWNNASTGSKMLASIGIMLGGYGGTSNGALSVMNKAIDRDIESQQSEQGKAMNLWKMNHQAYQDEQDATLATKNQLLSVAQAKAQQAAANALNPAAKLRAIQLTGAIEQEKEKNRMLMGMQGQDGGMSKMDPSVLVPKLVPPEHQKAVFDEISKSKHVSENESNMLALFDKAAQETRPASGMSGRSLMNALPYYHPPSVKGLFALEDPLIHDLDGRINEAEQNDLRGLHPAWGDSDATVAEKRVNFLRYIQQKKEGNVARAFGMDLNRFNKTSGNDNPNNSAYKPGTILNIKGKGQYQLGADGKSLVPVR